MVLFEIVRELAQGTLSIDTLRMLDPPMDMKGEGMHDAGYRNRDEYIRALLSRFCTCGKWRMDDV